MIRSISTVTVITLQQSLNNYLYPLAKGFQIFHLISNPLIESCTTVYENALKRINYQHILHYSDNTKQDGTPKRKRTKNVIWFNPPFRKNVKTNIGKQFLNLIDTHFPPSSTLHRLFNRNTVKISYCLYEKR